MKSRSQVFLAFLGVGLIVAGWAAFYLQRERETSLTQELTELRERSAELEILREENKRLERMRVESEELERLRRDVSELPRLRAEVRRLRGQQSELEQFATRMKNSSSSRRLSVSVQVRLILRLDC